MALILRLSLRRYGVELAVMGAAVVCLTVASAVIAWLIAQSGAPGLSSAGTGGPAAQWMTWVPYLRLVFVGLPALCGVALATSLVASELEAGTVSFIWSVVPSRRRWVQDAFAVGLIFLLALVAPLVVVDQVLTHVMSEQSQPAFGTGIDPGPSLIAVGSTFSFALTFVVSLILRNRLSTILASVAGVSVVLSVISVPFGRFDTDPQLHLPATWQTQVGESAVLASAALILMLAAVRLSNELRAP